MIPWRLSKLICQADVTRLTCPNCPVLCHVCLVMIALSWLSCFSCPVIAVLSYHALAILTAPSCHGSFRDTFSSVPGQPYLFLAVTL